MVVPLLKDLCLFESRYFRGTEPQEWMFGRGRGVVQEREYVVCVLYQNLISELKLVTTTKSQLRTQ